LIFKWELNSEIESYLSKDTKFNQICVVTSLMHLRQTIYCCTSLSLCRVLSRSLSYL